MLGFDLPSRLSHAPGNEIHVFSTPSNNTEPAERETSSAPSTMVPVSLDLRPGAEPIAGYRLVPRLGQGGFGVVWEAEAPGAFAWP